MFHSSSIFESLANSLPLSLLIKDASGERVFANEAYLKWLGASAAEVIGKRDADLFPAEIAAKFRADDLHVLESGESMHSVEQTLSPNGQVQWIERVKSPVLNSERRPIGLVILFWDVTERVHTETSRDHEQHLLNTLLENIPDSIYFKDLESRFLRISTAMATKFGMKSIRDAIGKTDADIFSGEHAHGAREDELQIMSSGVPMVDQVERETWPDKPDTWCMTTKMPLLDHNGKLLGTFGISRDVTELKQSQDALREALLAADSANRAKSDFLANMSHEIRTPMNAIIGMSHLLSQTRLDAEQREFVNLVSESADSLLRLLNDILDFSKIEARKLDLESIPFSLRETIGKAAQTLAIRAAQKSLELACRISTDIPDWFSGDPGRLRQILINLIGNAIKFTDAGEVVVDVTLVDITEGEAAAVDGEFHPSNCSLMFHVRDTGIGIAPEHHASVLEAFTQADTSTTRRFGGTGLGLSIAGQLIGLMHGQLQLESEVGVGTTFFFTIQLPTADKREFAEPAERLLELAGLPVLVVDDNSTNRRILDEIFRAWQFYPTLVESGQAAIDAQQQAAKAGTGFRLIILDCMMPGMDGFEVAKQIREHFDAETCKIIMLSSADRHGDQRRCRELGIARFLNKPVMQSELLDSVLQVLGIESSLSQQPTQADLLSCPPMRVLVAEDGIANQHVAIGMLKALGHTPVVAADGQEAIAKWTDGSFDMILMDMHMPLMDGLEATRRIRVLEEGTGKHIPIVALTAAAMAQDAAACRDAGMDEFLAKPIHPSRLNEMLLRFADPNRIAVEVDMTPTVLPADENVSREAAATLETQRMTEDSKEICDLVAAASRFPGGMAGVKRVSTVFRQECDTLMKTLRTSLPSGNPRDVQRAAHTLKGSALLFEAKQVHGIAKRIEQFGADADLNAAWELLPELESAVELLLHALPKD